MAGVYHKTNDPVRATFLLRSPHGEDRHPDLLERDAGARLLLGDAVAFRIRVEDCSAGGVPMCRNIRVLFNVDPPSTDEEIRAAALQFVRKVSGFAKPSAANEAAFKRAVEKIAGASSTLLQSLVTAAPARNRDEALARARERAAARSRGGSISSNRRR